MFTRHSILTMSTYQVQSRHRIGYPLYSRVLRRVTSQGLHYPSYHRIRMGIYCAYACEPRGSAAGIYLDSVACIQSHWVKALYVWGAVSDCPDG